MATSVATAPAFQTLTFAVTMAPTRILPPADAALRAREAPHAWSARNLDRIHLELAYFQDAPGNPEVTFSRKRVIGAVGPYLFAIALLCFTSQGGITLWSSLFAPHLQCDSLVANLGEVVSGDQPIARFQFKNTGNSDLVIHQVRASCSACLQVSKVPQRPLAAGEVGEIEVRLLSHKLIGAASRSVFVTTNDPRHPQVQLRIQASISPPTDPESPPVPISEK